MTITRPLVLTALAASLLGGCMVSSQPQPTAYERNVGPGSTVTGVPNDGKGTVAGGQTTVPGVSSAGSIGK